MYRDSLEETKKINEKSRPIAGVKKRARL